MRPTDVVEAPGGDVLAGRAADPAAGRLFDAAAVRPADVDVNPSVLSEQTRRLPVLKPLSAAGRTVIVYEQAPRRPWFLWVFTVVLVALTTGVVLGQAEAWQPTSRAAAKAPIPASSYSAPPPAVVPPPFPGSGAAGSSAPTTSVGLLTMPLGAETARTLRITGPATTVRIRSADLAEAMFRVTPAPRSPLPRLRMLADGPSLNLSSTGADIFLSPRIRWTIRITAPVTTLDVRTATTIPIRLALPSGAEKATVDDKSKSGRRGAVLTSGPYESATNRYDITAVHRVGTVTIVRADG